MTSSFDRRSVHVPRHDVGPLADWRSSLDNTRQRREIVLARDPLPSDGTDLLDCDVELLCLASLFEEHRAELPVFAARGSGAAAAAVLSQSEPEGSVILIEPGRAARTIPVGPAQLNPANWRDGLMLACVARDTDARAVLTAQQRVRACQLPEDRQDAFWLPYCLALASLVAATDDFTRNHSDAIRLIDESSITSPDVLTQLDRPLLDLAGALHHGDQSLWDEQVERALRAHHVYAGSGNHRFERRGFVSIGILGLCALAYDRGLHTSIESPYIPAQLVRHEQRAELSRVVYQFVPRRLVRDPEANWFLDLAGFPRTGRTHRVGDVNGQLVARYEAEGAATLPRARVDFVLSDATSPGELLPDALDAGELLALARRFATAAGDAHLSDAERRAALQEAVDCIDSALDRIPPGADAVPGKSIRSPVGQAEFAAEPGRFRRDRLQAYRDRLSEQLPPGPDHVAARAFGEIIAAQARPLLEALARDRGGTVARELAPRDEDYAAVFIGNAIDVARRFYADLWAGGLKLQYPSVEQTNLLVFVAPAGMLSSDNELSRQFPGGYQAIAGWLNPHRTWLRWKYVRPGQTIGLAYDGLVWCDDHWAWFPKPFRALAPLGAR